MQSIRRAKLSKTRVLFIVIATLILAGGALLFIINLRAGPGGLTEDKPPAQSLESYRPDEPDSTPDPNAHKVAADLPRIISIPKINVKARVLALGVKGNNELKAPANIYDTGWYQDSSKPGEQGAMLIDGHVHGPTKPGVFYDLKKLASGDTITVERGDGQIFNYKVVKSIVYDQDKVDMAAALVSAEAGKPGLNLITCTGAVDLRTSRYQDRLIVFAALAQSS